MLTPVYNLTVGSVAGVRTLAFGNGSVVDGGNGLATYTAPSTSPGGSSGQLQYNSGGSFAGAAALTYATSGANLTVTASGAAVVPLVCKGTTSQTANLLELQNSSGTVGARVTSAVQFSNASVDATTEQFGAGVSMASGVTFSLAVGTVATLATGVSRGVAVGYGASVASGTWYATAVGYLAQVSVTNDTTGSTAIGAQANVTGAGGTAIGRVATAGVVGTAIGYGTTAGQQAVAIGNLATATTSAVAIGDWASATTSAVVIGRNCSAPGGIAMGYQATSSGQGDVAFCTAGEGNNEDARLTMFAASVPLFNNPKRQWRLWGTWADNSALGYKGRLRGMVCDATNTTGIEAWRIESDGTYGLTSVGGVAVTSSTALTVASPTAAYKSLVIKGATSQSANLLESQDSTGTVGLAVAANARDLILDTTTGTKIGTATTQKFAFWNATPVVQQVLATGAAHTVDDVITLLQTLGLCRQS